MEEIEADLDEILRRLHSEEEDHEQIKESVAQAYMEAKLAQERIMALEARLQPLIDVAPVMADFAATGRVGRLLGKIAIGFAAFLAAIAGIWYSIKHGI